MRDAPHTNMRAVGQYWSRTLTSVARGQWSLLDTGLQAVQTVLTSAPASPDAESAQTHQTTEAAGSGIEDLTQRALERTRKGLSPPKEIYEVQYRNRIDWSRFPEWVRPSDPELFEGSCHEG